MAALRVWGITEAITNTPTIIGDGVFIHQTSVFTVGYLTATIAPGATFTFDNAADNSVSEEDFPIVAASRVGPLETLSIYVKMSCDGANAEAWELHVTQFSFIEKQSSGTVELIAAGGGDFGAVTKLFTHTHPGATTTTETEIHIARAHDKFIVGGGGSGVLVDHVGQSLLLSPYFGFEFKNTGATDTYTIDDIRVWGNFRSIH